MDRIIEVKVCGNHLTKDSNVAGTRGEGNITKLRITFDESWEDYAKSVIFWDAYGQNPVRVTLTVQMIENISKSTRVYIVPIPHEAMARAGWLTFSIQGSLGSKKQVGITSELEVNDSPDILEPLDPTPSEVEQLQGEIDAIKDDLRDFETAHDETTENARIAKESADRAEATVGKSSYIGENGNWFSWDEEKGEFYDTGVKAQSGSIVYMGENPPEDADVWISQDGGTTFHIRNESGEFVPIPTIKGKDGKSAYDQAVESGYKGTLAQFTTLLTNLTYTIEAEHLSDTNNPHEVTARQTGAIPEAYHLSTDLDIELLQGGGKMTVCYYTSGTLNTPKAEGITDYAHGMVITNAYTEQYGTQLCIPSGDNNMYLRRCNKLGITPWLKLSPDDIKKLQEQSAKALSKEGGTITGGLVIDKPEAWAHLVLRTPSDYYRAIEANDEVMRLDVRDEQLANKRRYLEIYTNTAESRLSHAIRIAQTIDGVSKSACLLHTENINDFVVSNNTYEGASSNGLSPKTITIRKTTQAVMIYGSEVGGQRRTFAIAFRGEAGGIGFVANNYSFVPFNCEWSDTSLKLSSTASANDCYNNVSYAYRYVLIG